MSAKASDHPVGFEIIEIPADYFRGIFFRAGLLGGSVELVPQILEIVHNVRGKEEQLLLLKISLFTQSHPRIPIRPLSEHR